MTRLDLTKNETNSSQKNLPQFDFNDDQNSKECVFFMKVADVRFSCSWWIVSQLLQKTELVSFLILHNGDFTSRRLQNSTRWSKTACSVCLFPDYPSLKPEQLRLIFPPCSLHCLNAMTPHNFLLSASHEKSLEAEGIKPRASDPLNH